jgi:hypothetical protein
MAEILPEGSEDHELLTAPLNSLCITVSNKLQKERSGSRQGTKEI